VLVYYIIDGTIYEAPMMSDVIGARVATVEYHLRRAWALVRERVRYVVNQTTYTFDVESTREELQAEDNNTDDMNVDVDVEEEEESDDGEASESERLAEWDTPRPVVALTRAENARTDAILMAMYATASEERKMLKQQMQQT
jgi:hypothetical protein